MMTIGKCKILSVRMLKEIELPMYLKTSMGFFSVEAKKILLVSSVLQNEDTGKIGGGSFGHSSISVSFFFSMNSALFCLPDAAHVSVLFYPN